MNLEDLDPTVQVGKDVIINAKQVNLGSNVVIGDHVRIDVDKLVLGDGVLLDSHVIIKAQTFEMGMNSHIETRVSVTAIGAPAKLIRIGEQSSIGHDSKMLIPVAVIGDYVSIQNHILMNGFSPLIIGHNTWIGQNCVINSNKNLTIGNNVGIGAYSSVYTHGFFGDLLEGCQVFKEEPVTIGDDVWILGCYNIISPGVTIGDKALILTGSNVTKNVPMNHTFGGAPAKDMTDRLVPFREMTSTDKFVKMDRFLREYVVLVYPGAYEEVDDGYVVNADFGSFRILLQERINALSELPQDMPLLVFTPEIDNLNTPDEVTIFDLMNRTYTKQRTVAEINTIKWLKNPRARFVPIDQPHVVLPQDIIDEYADC